MTTNYIRVVRFNHHSRRPSRYAVASEYELDRKHVLINISRLSFSNGTFKTRGDVFHYLPSLYPSQRLGNVFKINSISVHCISAESTKKPICEQRSEYKPTQDVSFMAYTIDKEVFLRNFSIHYTYTWKKFFQTILIVLRYLSQLRVVLPLMQILMNLIRL